MGVFSRKKDQPETYPQSQGRAATQRAASGPSDDSPLELDRRRARRRLIGAAALAIGAVVFLPMIFDSEPKNPQQPLSVQIPDKDTPFTPAEAGANANGNPGAGPVASPGPPTGVAAAPTAAVPATGSPSITQPSTGPAPTDGSEPGGVAASPGTSSPAAASSVNAAQPGPPPVRSGTPGGPGSAEREAGVPSEGARPTEKDDPRAVAALEGRVIDPTPAKPGASPAGRFAVQIGAFSTSDKVKERVRDLREKLASAGLKTYTEDLETPQGPRVRLRVGPYASRDAAEKAREKVRSAGLDGAIIPL